MKTFMKPWWCGAVSCVFAAGCAVESAPEGEISEVAAVESVGTSTNALSSSGFGSTANIPSGGNTFKFGAAITSARQQLRRVYAIRNSDSHMMSVSWTSSGWSGWGDLSGEFKSKPAAVSWSDSHGNDRFFVVGLGLNDGHYWFGMSTPFFSGWSAIPTGIFDSAPAAARVNNKIVVCGRAGPQIWCATNPLSSNNLTSWTPWVKAVDGEFFDSDPALASNIDRDTLQLVGRKSNGTYKVSSSFDGVAWTNFVLLPDNNFSSSPGVSGRLGNKFDFFGPRSTNGSLWQMSSNESNFKTLSSTSTMTAPSAYAWSDTHVDVVALHPTVAAVPPTGHLMIKTWQGP